MAVGFDKASDLRAAGFQAFELKEHFESTALRAAGYAAAELLRAEFPLPDVQEAFPDLKDLREAGLTVSQLMQLSEEDVAKFRVAGFTAREVRDGSVHYHQSEDRAYSVQALRHGGFFGGVSGNLQEKAEDLRAAVRSREK